MPSQSDGDVCEGVDSLVQCDIRVAATAHRERRAAILEGDVGGHHGSSALLSTAGVFGANGGYGWQALHGVIGCGHTVKAEFESGHLRCLVESGIREGLGEKEDRKEGFQRHIPRRNHSSIVR